VARPYIFEDRDAEQRRLDAQAGLLEPLTERVFRAAGLQAGMRVLELGSGAGHVAALASRLVGPRGHVVGVERDPQAVANARERATAAALTNVEFLAGDVQTLEGVDGTFDAVVGRLILLYLPDPVEALARAASHLRPDGLVIAQEADLAYDWAAPQSALWSQVRGWFLETLAAAHVEPRMGLRLHRCFVEAGLSAPTLTVEAAAAGGPEAPTWGWANLVRGVVPVMERSGVATAAEVGADTLAERLLADTLSAQGVVIAPPMFGAWARTRSS
jgi:SAM-dependent methyltransferase